MLRSLSAALLLSAAVASAADLFPFTLPWDDSSATVISLAHLNDKPAGRDGFVQVKDGHLFAGDKRLRIFGVNVCFGANFPTHEAAEKIAARMAKFGINCVRFHHMDMFSAPAGIFAKDGKTLDPERLDRLDYFIAKLKEHGIYSNLNLHVSRTYPDRPKAEKKGNPSYDKGVDNYDSAMIALQRDFARDLLHHKNAYTGNRYADEPAIAIVEINNENALGFQWWAGEMDDLPAPYAAELGKQWGAWVTAKYQDDDKARAAWSEGAQPFGEEMVDTDFDKQESSWVLEKQGGAEAEARVGIIPGELVTATLGEPARNSWNLPDKAVSTVTIRVAKAGSEPWHVQFSQAGLKVEGGRTYTAAFFAKGDSARRINVNVSQAHEPWKVLGSTQVELTPQWKHYEVTFRLSAADANARLSFSNLGTAGAEYSLADVSLRSGGIDGALARDPERRVPMLKKRELARHTPAQQRDWQQFLWDTETAYWNGMRDFLKQELGVKAPIVGTQGFWSPAHVQAGMDIIDSHAYWHHPDFHGRGWNQEVWTVKNESMAGAPDGGEFARLAAQRVKGKPFICTEYNHPAPNTYAAETFPLLLAFAAAQDWDGVFAFSYSHRTDAWDQGHFNNFFDIDRHSVKMATLPAAVLCFRRGDLPPLEQVAVLEMSSEDAVNSAIRGGPGFVRHRPEFKSLDLSRVRFRSRAEFVPQTVMNPISESGPRAEARLTWHGGPKQRARFDAKRSSMIAGRFEPEEVLPMGGVSLRHRSSRQGWASFQATVLEGADFSTATRMLITATGDTENTGQVWNSPEKTSVGRNWGKAPVLVEAPAAEIRLQESGPWRAWALDETGARRAEVPLRHGILPIGPEHRTLWYELSRE